MSVSVNVNDMIHVLAPTSHEAEARPFRVKEILVVDYSPSDVRSRHQLAWAGTISIYIAPSDSELLPQILQAAETRDGSDIEIAAAISEQISRRPTMSLQDAVKQLVVSPSFADIVHGGRTIASNMFVPDDLGVCAVGVPYNGGSLAESGLLLVEHYLDHAEYSLSAIALRRAPPLSEMEKAALRVMPPDQFALNVGRASLCWATSAVTVAATVCAATSVCCPHVTDEKLGLAPTDGHLTEDAIRMLGPAATARALLAARREILLRS
jgi:hypothetical protein